MAKCIAGFQGRPMKSGMRARVVRDAALAAILFVLPVATGAAEGRTPLFEPGNITASGKYVLTRNITATGGVPGIWVQALQVDIDLNGFTVSTSNGDAAILVTNPNAQLTVRNGTLTDCFSGVYATAAAQVTLEDLTVKGTWSNGIDLNEVRAITIRRVSVMDVAQVGIGIQSPTGSPHNAVIEDCLVRGTGSNGIVFNFGTAQIVNNRVIAAGYGGISINAATGSTVSGNLVVGAANDIGITVSATQGSTLSGNIVRGSYWHGIRLTADSTNNLVRDNVVTGNGLTTPGHGLYVEGTFNQIEGNTLNANGQAGLFFSATGCGNTFGRNMARGNIGAFVGGCTSLFPPESCSQCSAGTPNASFGDNLIPGPPIF